MMKIPVTIMRGGTSKGIFILEEHMPTSREQWQPFLLDLMGSPDQKQIDGLGGANSLTSKVAIIKRSTIPGIDVEYTFAQVSITQQTVDFKGNCGNISSAVAPFAIEQGLVAAHSPLTRVTIFNTNTNKCIISEVEVQNGQVKTEGSVEIPGVPGTGSPIYLSFRNAEGAVTSKLYPTGSPIDTIIWRGKELPISIVDFANPLVFLHAQDIGLSGTELPNEYTEEQLTMLEEIRSIAAELCGFCSREEATLKSPAVPKMTVVAAPTDYKDMSGNLQKANQMDLLIRMMSMQKPHGALAITGAICTSAAIYSQQTILKDIVGLRKEIIRLGHPAGIMQTKLVVSFGKIESITVIRTARRIMEGYAFTKKSYSSVPLEMSM
ncbi:2-methylaconitate cis-trans isomerase PrpF family protein [Psychrobacillus sp. BM2]|uniref:2-methylaconitate cis-trans isomerase PrpF family protein n=1 Tax=Psychrobacillus sp. BM2 TaxID=3400421 RepID=UPI003B0102C8